LGAALFVFGLVREPPLAAADASWPFLYVREMEALAAGGEDDLALLNACLEVEYELRRRQWKALEHLLPFLEGAAAENQNSASVEMTFA
jgi:hypothetical protein